ncbi:MAG: orotidine-5'-phosphate decarboxylase [Phycisphaerales bacterium]
MNRAITKLDAVRRARGSLLSIGLEPSPKYLPAGFEPRLPDYERFLRLIVSSTLDVAAAYKFNVAFFEALGAKGVELLERVRAEIPANRVVIIDAKRGDIGATAAMYARAIFDHLDADATTVNPLMGRDAIEPFLAWSDRLTYVLALTSNPGASDFLLRDGLFERIVERVRSWDEAGCAGFVVGATRGEDIAAVRAKAPDSSFLVPGVGAQGGEIGSVVTHGAAAGSVGDVETDPHLLFHVTRGVLPDGDFEGDVGTEIHRKATAWLTRVREAMAYGDAAFE